MIEELDGVVNLIDDLLVWGDSVEEHDHRLRSCWTELKKII